MTTEDLIARIKNPHWSDRADSLLKEAADALEAQGREVAELKPLAALGAEMHAMTTTVHTDSIPFKEQLQIVPSLWLECMKERDKARAELESKAAELESVWSLSKKADEENDTLRAELAAIRAQEPVGILTVKVRGNTTTIDLEQNDTMHRLPEGDHALYTARTQQAQKGGE